MVAPAFFDENRNDKATNAIFTEITKMAKAVPSNHDPDTLRLSINALSRGWEQYKERTDEIQRQKDLVETKQALRDAIRRIEEYEKVLEKDAVDKTDKKRMAEEELVDQLGFVNHMRKRFKQDEVKGENEDGDIEDQTDSQELGTITL